QVVSFLGIRYAEPPVGELRFKKPKKAKLLGGLMDTTKWANSCFQPTDNNFGNFFGSNMWNPNTPMDEDCLFLNVFVPQQALEGTTTQKLSVMIWIYGGGFYSGTSSLTMYDGKSLAASNGVIVVTINYRVGIWGFFGLGNSETPTNVGLWDQLLALEWVNTHIHGFNGDPNSVTLFGESAGAVSVSLHLLSPLSWKYFNRAIMQSGTANMPWAVMTMNETIRRSKALVEALNCNNSRNIASEVKCMRDVSNDKIIDNQWVSRGFVQFPFGPTIDGEFVTEHPDELLRKGLFKKCPILLGSNANEASFFLIYEFGELLTLNSMKMSQKNATDCINSVYNYYPQFPKIVPSDVLKAINFYYTHETEESAPDLEHFKNLDEAASDGQFLCPLNEFSKAFVESDLPVYMYYFTERLDNHLWPSYMGVLHADEIFFMFSDEIQTKIKFTERETGFSRLMSKLWANFAK
ncbi:hypothetical protein HELRODRAFT_120724, partial [Helobdella robusta]|uniref:Carboxylesterase type B domain-containing protein n=1 Tax=Helobdella robusta TaxID=6412 RepID=T1EGQ4_HELRO